MKVAALISGGKDSILALHKVAEKHELVSLVGVFPRNADSYMFHSVNLHMLDVVAESIGLPLKKLYVSGEEEKEVDELAEQVGEIDAEALCIGGIESNYQKKRFERVCREAGMELIAPLWKMDPERLMREVAEKFEAVIVSVSAMGLDESFLGRRIDENCIEDLKKLNKKYGVHLAGEGGEFETLVLDTPLYRFRIKIDGMKKFWDGVRGYCLIESYSKISKS
ncbi:MAG: TIGR00289 family protein [Archaeoglobus sp.]|uniref:diphthine--ammonia ligase n=1 Tax=Archaeoglobus sp. TaxID=1872626 RepID=UPI001DD919B1|nr:TIGR00289 family protein [Archaeoglobus sp.]MBO8180082.1 TIGR00289 family protein [Archaeoglobus sp.]